MAIKHSHRHRIATSHTWKIIGNFAKHFALFATLLPPSTPLTCPVSFVHAALESHIRTKHCFIPQTAGNFSPWWLFPALTHIRTHTGQKLWQCVPVWPFILLPHCKGGYGVLLLAQATQAAIHGHNP